MRRLPHAGRFGGDGGKIYTRADRRVKNASGLAQQITTCNAMLGNNLFPEDELHLAAYLNGQYYKRLAASVSRKNLCARCAIAG
jgi:hypothetical protein